MFRFDSFRWAGRELLNLDSSSWSFLVSSMTFEGSHLALWRYAGPEANFVAVLKREAISGPKQMPKVVF